MLDFQVLKALLEAVLGLAQDSELQPDAQPFALGVCAHFALLFSAGASSPPPAPPSSRTEGDSTRDGDGTSSCPPSLKV